MNGDAVRSAERVRPVLSPQERTSEVLFGLIMVITFTGSLSVAAAGRDEVRAMLVGAFGCNLAWGIIDAVFYLMGCTAERGRRILLLRSVRNAPDGVTATRLIAQSLPPLVASLLRPDELQSIHRRLLELPEPRGGLALTREDAFGALGVFLLVFCSTFPVALPFVFMHDTARAMRLSNAIALVMLLATGAVYGRAVGRSPWRYGAAMVVLGALLVALTIALGG